MVENVLPHETFISLQCAFWNYDDLFLLNHAGDINRYQCHTKNKMWFFYFLPHNIACLSPCLQVFSTYCTSSSEDDLSRVNVDGDAALYWNDSGNMDEWQRLRDWQTIYPIYSTEINKRNGPYLAFGLQFAHVWTTHWIRCYFIVERQTLPFRRFLSHPQCACLRLSGPELELNPQPSTGSLFIDLFIFCLSFQTNMLLYVESCKSVTHCVWTIYQCTESGFPTVNTDFDFKKQTKKKLFPSYNKNAIIEFKLFLFSLEHLLLTPTNKYSSVLYPGGKTNKTPVWKKKEKKETNDSHLPEQDETLKMSSGRALLTDRKSCNP